MKKYFYFGAILLILFEIANVFFILPIPGSQDMRSVGLAYFLFSWKWTFRVVSILLMLIGIKEAWSGSKILTILMLVILAGVLFMANFRMKADRMFYEPDSVIMSDAAHNKVPADKLILGIEHNGAASAYPINYLAYHHKVHDTIGTKPIMATYCSVCRTGRVFEPIVNGKNETFRLVGMDHYNAMFEDNTTKSWWRQVTGECVAGKLKGQSLPEYPSVQTTLRQWFELYPNSLVLQPDPAFQIEYDSLADFETGMRTGRLERRDTAAWQDKSWVVGIEIDNASKAYDWNELVTKQVINDVISSQPIVVFVSDDNQSLFAYQRNSNDQQFTIRNDTLTDGFYKYDLLGHSYQTLSANLKPIQAYQEYWHSWRTFHPATIH